LALDLATLDLTLAPRASVRYKAAHAKAPHCLPLPRARRPVARSLLEMRSVPVGDRSALVPLGQGQLTAVARLAATRAGGKNLKNIPRRIDSVTLLGYIFRMLPNWA